VSPQTSRSRGLDTLEMRQSSLCPESPLQEERYWGPSENLRGVALKGRKGRRSWSGRGLKARSNRELPQPDSGVWQTNANLGC
jgi:hypothetical protein